MSPRAAKIIEVTMEQVASLGLPKGAVIVGEDPASGVFKVQLSAVKGPEALAEALPVPPPPPPFVKGPEPADGLVGSPCAGCGKIVKKGEIIVWGGTTFKVAHVKCVSSGTHFLSATDAISYISFGENMETVPEEEEDDPDHCDCGAFTCACECDPDDTGGDEPSPEAPPSGIDPSDYAEPDMLGLHAIYDLWELPTVLLPKEASDFYLLEYLGSVLEHPEARELQAAQVARLAPVLANYTNFALGGELRHVIRYTKWVDLPDSYQKFYPDPNIDLGLHLALHRPVAWRGWHGVWVRHGVDAICAAEEMFRDFFERSTSYGGPAWSRIAKTLADYLKGVLRPKLFVDRVWSIQHNGGTLLNKAPQRLLGLELLGSILDAQKSGDLATLRTYASSGVVRLYLKLVEHEEGS